MGLLDDEERHGLILGSLASSILAAVVAGRTGNDPVAAATMGLSTGFGQGLDALTAIKHQQLEEEKTRELMQAARDKQAYLEKSFGLHERQVTAQEKQATTQAAREQKVGEYYSGKLALEQKAQAETAAEKKAKQDQINQALAEQRQGFGALNQLVRPETPEEALSGLQPPGEITARDLYNVVTQHPALSNNPLIQKMIQDIEKQKVQEMKGEQGLTQEGVKAEAQKEAIKLRGEQARETKQTMGQSTTDVYVTQTDPDGTVHYFKQKARINPKTGEPEPVGGLAPNEKAKSLKERYMEQAFGPKQAAPPVNIPQPTKEQAKEYVSKYGENAEKKWAEDYLKSQRKK
jgi:hypothetical protein